MLYGIEKHPAGDLRMTASFRFRYDRREGTGSYSRRGHALPGAEVPGEGDSRGAWLAGSQTCLLETPRWRQVRTRPGALKWARPVSWLLLKSNLELLTHLFKKSILPSSYFNKVFFKRWRNRCFFFSTGIFCLRRNPLSESGSQALSVKCPVRNKITPVPPVCTNLLFFLKKIFSFLIEV